jgi:hypothetical protein
MPQRNGYRERDGDTRAGTEELRICRLPEGRFPGLPRAAADGREGAHHDNPGGLHPAHLDPLSRDLVKAMGMSVSES